MRQEIYTKKDGTDCLRFHPEGFLEAQFLLSLKGVASERSVVDSEGHLQTVIFVDVEEPK